MNHKSECAISAIDSLFGQEFSWSAPSNIALVKYWGKKPGVQIPTNPSVSLTLENARTDAVLRVVEKKADSWIDLVFEGKSMPAFLPKIEKFFNFVAQYFPSLLDFSFQLETKNSFPHSAGIASSASSMAAIALCLVELEEKVSQSKYAADNFLQRASFFARLGSGSACRSLFADCASWGHYDGVGNDLLAEPIPLHSLFKGMRNSVILVDKSEKKVSSRAGHGLMQGHLFGDSRTSQANANWSLAKKWLKDGSWDMLGSLVEEEALTLHAMMMTSRPGYMLMKPESISIIEKVREFRLLTKTPLYFTMDAGPNVHLLYLEEDEQQVLKFIDEKILFENGPKVSVLHDRVGRGPRKLKGGTYDE